MRTQARAASRTNTKSRTEPSAGAVASPVINPIAVAGTTLGLLIRSTTTAVLVAFAWTFPLEHIVQNAWQDAAKYLPGLVFANTSMGGSDVAGYSGPLLLGAGPPVVQSSAPAADLDALFERTDGWIGGDGAYSVVLSPARTIWLVCRKCASGRSWPSTHTRWPTLESPGQKC